MGEGEGEIWSAALVIPYPCILCFIVVQLALPYGFQPAHNYTAPVFERRSQCCTAVGEMRHSLSDHALQPSTYHDLSLVAGGRCRTLSAPRRCVSRHFNRRSQLRLDIECPLPTTHRGGPPCTNKLGRRQQAYSAQGRNYTPEKVRHAQPHLKLSVDW